MRHTLNWFEIPVTNLERAMRFYAAMTGKALRREQFGAPDEHMAIFETGSEEAISGALVSGPQSKPSADGSVVYLNAEPSIDAWLTRAEANGGKILVPKTALPEGMGFFAHVLDTEGNRLGLHALA